MGKVIAESSITGWVFPDHLTKDNVRLRRSIGVCGDEIVSDILGEYPPFHSKEAAITNGPDWLRGKGYTAANIRKVRIRLIIEEV